MRNPQFSFWKRALLSLGAAALVLSACKKSNDNSNPAGISATIAGKSWVASTTAGSLSGSDVILYGFVTGDKSQFAIEVDNGITVGKADNGDYSYLSYILSDGTYYTSSAGYGGTTSVTVSSWDTNNKKVVGTFTGVLYNTDNAKDSVVVTNGKFNMTYTDAPQQ